MAYARRDIRGGAVQTALSTGCSSGATSLAITSSTGWPDGSVGPFYVVIDPGLSTEEKVLCATRTSLSLAVTTRGADGSSASAHASGAVIYPVVTAVDIDEANYTVSQTVGKITSAGDLLVGSAANTLARTAKGSNSTVFGVDSGGTLGYTTVTSAMITDGTIVNTDVNAAAAIAYSKLNLASSITSSDIVDGTIVNGDINASAAIAYSKLNLANSIVTGDIVNGTILDADINGSAAISVSKTALAAGTGLSLSGNTMSVDSSLVTLGASTSFTPTVGQGGTSNISKTVTQAHYIKIGKVVLYTMDLAITGSGTSSSEVNVTLPVTGVRTTDTCGSGYIFDQSASNNYKGVVIMRSATVIGIATDGGILGVNDFSAALASGDGIHVSGWYEAA